MIDFPLAVSTSNSENQLTLAPEQWRSHTVVSSSNLSIKSFSGETVVPEQIAIKTKPEFYEVIKLSDSKLIYVGNVW